MIFYGLGSGETELAFVALSVGPDLEFLALGEGDSFSSRVVLLVEVDSAKR